MMINRNSKVNNHFFILTGGPGVGKTSVLNALQNKNLSCVQEVARCIIKNQQSQNGDGLPWKNREQYKNLMLTASVMDYEKKQEQKKRITFFDRGIPDTLAYAYLEGLSVTEKLHFYSHHYRYNTTVFVFPPWREIYRTDAERKQPFDEVIATHKIMIQTYKKCGYRPIILPKTTIKKRCSFILDTIATSKKTTILYNP